MNPTYFGDSYDLVKRFFCAELSALGYSVAVNPMFTGTWSGAEDEFYRLIGVEHAALQGGATTRSALFLDPDTGVKENATPKHVSFHQLVAESARYSLVFSFDQSFSRKFKPAVVMREKLASIRELSCHAMYYDSHARFLFVATQEKLLHELRAHLVSLGMPKSRLLSNET